MTLDRTIHRCSNHEHNYVARYFDGKKWWCKDHAPYGSKYVEPPKPPPPPELEGVLIGSARLQVRVKR